MPRLGRAILAVIAGAAVWAALWVGGTQAAQAAFPSALPKGQPITSVVALVGLILYSLPLSVLAGYLTATVMGKNPMPVVWALAVLQLIFGIIAETSAWSLAPVWYHLVFLALVIPATIYGGKLRVRRTDARAAYPPPTAVSPQSRR
jgi:hypothetical protein